MYVRAKLRGNYGGLNRVWGFGAEGGDGGGSSGGGASTGGNGGSAPSAGSAGPVMAPTSGIIATPLEPTRQVVYPGYYPGYPYAYPGYPYYGPQQQAAPQATPVPVESDKPVMLLPKFEAPTREKRRLFQRAGVTSQQARLGMVAALVGLGLLMF